MLSEYINIYICYRVRTEIMENSDERMKKTTEILNGIKYIKMAGWEETFLKKVK